MCGFAGFFELQQSQNNDSRRILREMGGAITHRGPDDEGVWFDSKAGIGFVHCRLSIIDLSPAGHQPMVSQNNNLVLVYNGEVYNHLALRKELERSGAIINWKGHSDTETILAGFEFWGVEKTLQSATGMFAFALWDKQKQTLILGRDRAGEKPLYYGWQKNGEAHSFVFGSELKAIKVHPSFEREIDRGALSLYMRYGYIPTPYSVYSGIYKLPAGTILSLNLLQLSDGSSDLSEIEPEKYWCFEKIIEVGRCNTFIGSATEAVQELEFLLNRAVAEQMVADVPLGAFLSGGIDSSTIVALMQTQSSSRIRTFSIGFEEEHYNEAGYARAIAKHLNTYHTEMIVSPRQALDIIPSLPSLYDEPFADSSQIPTYLVARLAREHVTVSLSGDAGDELFCGYSRYFLATKIWNYINRIPLPMRKVAVNLVRFFEPQSWTSLISILAKTCPFVKKDTNWGDKLYKATEIINTKDFIDLYVGLVSSWRFPEEVVLGGIEPGKINLKNNVDMTRQGLFEEMTRFDSLQYLPDDILTKVDRAAMSVSLETRIPMLDKRVIEFANRLPFELKVREGAGKWILRQVLEKYVPNELFDRPKKGFGIPVGQWLREPLRDWAECLLSEQLIKSQGYLNSELVREKWTEHLSGKRDWHYQLWNVLMFQAWLDDLHKGVG